MPQTVIASPFTAAGLGVSLIARAIIKTGRRKTFIEHIKQHTTDALRTNAVVALVLMLSFVFSCSFGYFFSLRGAFILTLSGRSQWWSVCP